MYLNGMGLRGIERVTDIHNTTVMGWIKQAGLRLPDTPESEEEPEIIDLDELQTGSVSPSWEKNLVRADDSNKRNDEPELVEYAPASSVRLKFANDGQSV